MVDANREVLISLKIVPDGANASAARAIAGQVKGAQDVANQEAAKGANKRAESTKQGLDKEIQALTKHYAQVEKGGQKLADELDKISNRRIAREEKAREKATGQALKGATQLAHGLALAGTLGIEPLEKFVKTLLKIEVAARTVHLLTQAFKNLRAAMVATQAVQVGVGVVSGTAAGVAQGAAQGTAAGVVQGVAGGAAVAMRSALATAAQAVLRFATAFAGPLALIGTAAALAYGLWKKAADDSEELIAKYKKLHNERLDLERANIQAAHADQEAQREQRKGLSNLAKQRAGFEAETAVPFTADEKSEKRRQAARIAAEAAVSQAQLAAAIAERDALPQLQAQQLANMDAVARGGRGRESALTKAEFERRRLEGQRQGALRAQAESEGKGDQVTASMRVAELTAQAIADQERVAQLTKDVARERYQGLKEEQNQIKQNLETTKEKLRAERESLLSAKERFLELDPGKQAKAIAASQKLARGEDLTRQEVTSVADFRGTMSEENRKRFEDQQEKVVNALLGGIKVDVLFGGGEANLAALKAKQTELQAAFATKAREIEAAGASAKQAVESAEGVIRTLQQQLLEVSKKILEMSQNTNADRQKLDRLWRGARAAQNESNGT